MPINEWRWTVLVDDNVVNVRQWRPLVLVVYAAVASATEKSLKKAFVLPGGGVVVYTGILRVARTDEELATVLGHEIAHVVARHGAEKIKGNVLFVFCFPRLRLID